MRGFRKTYRTFGLVQELKSQMRTQFERATPRILTPASARSADCRWLLLRSPDQPLKGLQIPQPDLRLRGVNRRSPNSSLGCPVELDVALAEGLKQVALVHAADAHRARSTWVTHGHACIRPSRASA